MSFLGKDVNNRFCILGRYEHFLKKIMHIIKDA